MTHVKVKITLTVPRSLVQHLQNPAALRQWLIDNKMWPAMVYDSRSRIDPLSQGTVIELEALVPVGDEK